MLQKIGNSEFEVIHLPVCLSVGMSVCLSRCAARQSLSVCPAAPAGQVIAHVRPCVCLPCPSVRPACLSTQTTWLSVCLHALPRLYVPFVCPPAHLSALRVCLPMMPCPSVYSDRLSILTFCLSVCLYVCPAP